MPTGRAEFGVNTARSVITPGYVKIVNLETRIDFEGTELKPPPPQKKKND